MEHITCTYQGKELSGTIIKDEEELTIKLDSGYNIILPKKDMENIKRKHIKTTAKKKVPVPQSKGQKKITILHTGGTIASKIDYETGAVTAKFTAEEILGLFPELTTVADVTSVLVGNMQSEMMRFAHWNVLAKAVDKAVQNGAEGIIITHGTDVLHMSAAALSFALENCPIPVLLVGSQRSSDRPSSDAASNVLCAAKFLVKAQFQGVGVCLHESIDNDTCVVLPGTRCRKMHTSRRDAFRPINDTPFARITYPELEIEQLKEYPQSSREFTVRAFDEKLKVGLVHMHPQMFHEEILAYNNFDGLVLALLGIGHAPTMQTDKHNAENENIMNAITKLAKKMPVAGAPQTIYGRVDMHVYSPGRQLIEAGVLGQGCDMTPETAFIKLAWLLSNEEKRVTELYGKNLRGEISERIQKNQFD